MASPRLSPLDKVVRSSGLGRLRSLGFRAYKGAWLGAASRLRPGTNVFEHDWDLLVVLDACRVDALRAVASEYDFIGAVDSVTSVGTTSNEWMARTFDERYLGEIRETAYVSANAFAERVIESRELPGSAWLSDWNVVSPEEFLLLDHAWRYQPEHRFKHMLSEHLTDRAITVGREYDPPRQIVHYLQPHEPYIANAIAEDREMAYYEAKPMEALRTGAVDRQTVWTAYLDDLRRGLDHVELLLRNVDADTVVVTADHGEAFGEWGMYGHPTGSPHPVVRRVPWVETTATDEGEYEPSFEYDRQYEKSVDAQLRDLGYQI